MEDLSIVAAQPHPVGSPANAEVRDYLLAQIAALDLQGEVQSTTVSSISPLSGIAQVTPVENVVVRVPGNSGAGDALLVTGHYDSVPTTPGAGDCGSCVATVLETLRAVRAGQPLQNDVIFLFTDAEELGIVGATAFMQQHPWAKDVKLSLVLEGLGTQGAAVLYAAGRNDGAVVREALDAMAEPGGFAYFHDVMWKLSGNSGSDLDAFVVDGRPGLAFVHLALDGSQAYHSGADNVAALDEGTLQQHGEQTLSLVRHFGNANLEGFVAEADAVYFTLLPGIVIYYPSAWALPLAVGAALLALAAVVYGGRRRSFGLLGVLGAVLLAPLGLVLVLAAATGAWYWLRLWNPNWHMYSVGGWYGAAWTTAGLVLLSLATLAGLWWIARRWLSVGVLAAGGLLWWGALALLTAPSLPGFGYLFALPLYVAAPAAAWCWSERGRSAEGRSAWARALVLAAPAAVAILLLTPVVIGLAVFGGRLEAITGLPLAALPLPFVVAAWLLLPLQIDFLAPRAGWRLPAVLLAAALLLLAMGVLRSGFDGAHPKLNTMVYWLDADTQVAHWITVNDSRAGRGTNAQLDEWTAQYLGTEPEPTALNPWPSGWFNVEYAALQSPAPLVDQEHSQVALLKDSAVEGGRLLRLEFTPAGDVQDLFVQILSEENVRITNINGEEVQGEPQPSVRLNVNGRPRQPVTIDLRAGLSPVEVIVLDRRIGLPATGKVYAPRPDYMAAAPFNDLSDSTIVAHTTRFE
jgi:hypothetical protein